MRKSRLRRALGKVGVALALLAGLAWLSLWARDFLGGAGSSASKAEATPASALERAEQLLAEGEHEAARALLQPLSKGARHAALAPQALILLARVEQGAGRPDVALANLKRAVDEFPSSPDRPKAAVAYARLLEERGGSAEARRVYEGVRASAPADLRAPALSGLGRLTEKEGDFLQARELFRQAAQDAKVGSPAWTEAADGLGRANIALIFSIQPTPESKEYEVGRGDNLTSIGNKLNTTQGLLSRANNLTEDARLSPGQRLKYTPKDFRIVIERSNCRLLLFDKDGLFKYYAAGLGMPGHETTLGKYKIGSKQKDPVWHKPGEGPIPAGDPRNELGTRWMPLVPAETGLPTDLGIHGTIAPETVGQFSSHGCARLLPAEIEELYDLVVRGTPVDIVEVYAPDGAG